MSPFDLYINSPYTFLEIEQGVEGNMIKAEHDATGIIKIRDTMVSTAEGENVSSNASVHIKPNESFIALASGNMVGHGLRISKNGSAAQDYRIIAQTEGYDFETDTVEFYRVILKREAIATWEESELPLH